MPAAWKQKLGGTREGAQGGSTSASSEGAINPNFRIFMFLPTDSMLTISGLCYPSSLTLSDQLPDLSTRSELSRRLNVMSTIDKVRIFQQIANPSQYVYSMLMAATNQYSMLVVTSLQYLM